MKRRMSECPPPLLPTRTQGLALWRKPSPRRASGSARLSPWQCQAPQGERACVGRRKNKTTSPRHHLHSLCRSAARGPPAFACAHRRWLVTSMSQGAWGGRDPLLSCSYFDTRAAARSSTFRLTRLHDSGVRIQHPRQQSESGPTARASCPTRQSDPAASPICTDQMSESYV
jgi:hypothetical protein